MNKKPFDTLKNLPLLQNKNSQILLSVAIILIAIALIVGVYFAFFTSENIDTKWISGTVFIDGNPAPEGVNVSIIFPDGSIVEDVNGTNQTGVYRIDVTDYVNEDFEVYIVYDGYMYVGTDENGNNINGTVSEDLSENLDVFVLTSNSTDDEGDDSGSSSDDSDGSNGDNGSDNDAQGSDDEDDGSDSSDDSGSDDSNNDGDLDSGSNDDGGSGNDSDGSGDNGGSDDEDDNDGTDNDTDDDDAQGDDNPTGDNVNETVYFTINKTVRNNTADAWNQELNVGVGEIIQFNVSISYNASNLTHLHIKDQLPDGFTYGPGNATINGTIQDPMIDEINHTLFWNLSAVSNVNKTLWLQYTATVQQRTTLKNNVTVTLLRNETTNLSKQTDATVHVFGELLVSKKVRNTTDSSWFEQKTVMLGDTIQFNITLEYNGSNQVSNISILEKIPSALHFQNNISTNAQDSSIYINSVNQTLFWNITELSQNLVWIQFDANITENTTVTNTVFVKANESTGKQFNISDSAKITGEKPLLLAADKKVKVGNSTWKNSIHAYVADNATYRVNVSNNMNVQMYSVTVIDKLPSNVEYINNSSIITYQNDSYQEEPLYDEENNTLQWIGINELITQSYLEPNNTLTIEYNVSILDPGIAENNVKVNATVCTTCTENTSMGSEIATASDSATINITLPAPELTVNIIVPDHIYVDEPAEISALISGGEKPYLVNWDLDNDSLFDDENSTSFTKTWNKTGEYPISVKVTDNNSETQLKTHIINVTYEPLTVNAGENLTVHPYESVQFNGVATGGYGNYSWFWDFDDGTTSNESNPTHTYEEEGMYTVTLNVTDERNTSRVDTRTITVIEPDDTAPIPSLDSPISAIYIKNRAVFPFFSPLIFGPVNISFSAIDENSSIDRIELYINTELVKTVNDSSGNYSWNDTVFGRQTIQVKAFDSFENMDFVEEKVWKFF